MFFMINEQCSTYEDFLQLSTREEVANYLGGSLKNLSYNFYVLPPDKQYHIFSIPKRSGGMRTIIAPRSSIKLYQRRLAYILSLYYKKKTGVYGYVNGRNIKQNAQVHCKKKVVINIDLKDFFPTIHFGRVRGVFKSTPFEFNDTVATTLAQICCYNGKLPQGAPTSPIISNFICRTLDNQLRNFASKYRLSYSRYADDITLSTNINKLPKEVATFDDNGNILLSKELEDIISNNQFQINQDKVRYSLKNNRQEVTGLVVNTKVNVRRKYIRQIRAMLHAWHKFGLKQAAIEHFYRYSTRNMPEYPDIAFRKILIGKINFVRYIKRSDSSINNHDKVYANIYRRLKSLDPTAQLAMPTKIDDITSCRAIIFCEGKTDGVHLTAALKYFVSKGEFVNLDIYFHHYPDEAKVNNSTLLKFCETSALQLQKRLTICLFDCDVPKYVNDAVENGKLYRNWGNNVYSCILPQPTHRNFKEICIEHFYTDDDLLREGYKGRRIYLSDEFDATTGKHRTEDLMLRKRTDAACKYPKIIDSGVGVFKPNGDNVALSKNDFANNVSKGYDNFKDISFEHFHIVFEMFKQILDEK